jgi:hypothetical protein
METAGPTTVVGSGPPATVVEVSRVTDTAGPSTTLVSGVVVPAGAAGAVQATATAAVRAARVSPAMRRADRLVAGEANIGALLRAGGVVRDGAWKWPRQPIERLAASPRLTTIRGSMDS